MNQFTVLVLVLVVFCYCGGKYCPDILKQNKQILLGVVGGLVLASFFGLRLEGYTSEQCEEMRNEVCNSGETAYIGMFNIQCESYGINC